MNRLARKALGCVREGITCDASGHMQLMYEILNAEKLDGVPTQFPPIGQARFSLERAPFPLCPHFPLAAAGIAAPFATVEAPSELETRLDFEDIAISIASERLELVLRGGHSAGIADSFLPSFIKALLGSPMGMFCGSWRLSLCWLGSVGSSPGVAPLPEGIPAHARWFQAFDLDDSPGQVIQDLDDVKKFRGSLESAQ